MAAAWGRPGALKGLRLLLDALETQPGLPVPTTVTVQVHAQSDLDGFERVARVAHRLGVTAVTTVQGAQRAECRFGPVAYVVEYHPQHAAVTL